MGKGFVKFREGIKFCSFLSEIDAGMKAMIDSGNDYLQPHFLYCKGDYFYGEEKTLKEIILAKISEHGIQSSIVTELKMIRKNLITKEIVDAAAEGKLKNKAEWKPYKGSINDDLESFLTKLLHQKEIDDEMVESFFLPKLTKKELTLVGDKDKEYLTTYLLRNPDVDVKEKRMLDSSYELNMGKEKFRLDFRVRKYVHFRCWRRTYKLNLGSIKILSEDRTSDELSDYVQITEANEIGRGGFSRVFRAFFQGEEKAMKCVWIGPGDSEYHNPFMDHELRVQVASGGSGILVPEAFVRQQDQEEDENGKLITFDYIIFIYPLYHGNLYELHEIYYDQFTDEILRDIMLQCLTRIFSRSKESVLLNHIFEHFKVWKP